MTFPTAIPTAPTILPNCICVLMSQCAPNGIVTISGEGIINPRYGLCPGNLVCCSILANTTTSPPTMMTTSTPPGETQLCFVCGNLTVCYTCMTVSTSDGGSMIDPRFSQVLSQGNICTVTNIPSCRSTSSNAPLTDLGSLKNRGTSQECYCVKTWLCSEGNEVSPDGLGIIDSRFTLCSSADQVCCRLAGISPRGLRNAGAFVSSARGPNEPANRSPQAGCGVQSNGYAPPQPVPPDSEETYFAEFPWMVALLLRSTTDSPYAFQCGASLVTNGAVLTAAHCVVNQKPENLIARFGQWNIGNSTQPLPIQEAKIFAIAVHPSYYGGGLFHDVAVLILAEPVTFSANVLPICLPEQGTVFLAGSRCYGLGWGSDSFGEPQVELTHFRVSLLSAYQKAFVRNHVTESGGQYQAELRKVNLPIVDQEDCQTRLRGTKLGQYFELHGSFICAGGEANRDTCRGDGGGPLVCQATTGQFFQAGIVSWGIGCGASNVPAVYASVSQHRQWIDQQFATYGV
ncbi:PREDICTED: transmembrane protease serine 9-like isoform X2 [Vollenhovia emeryi]|uniref:transmembrane protease serine 9-like isoform X2 n=1 Tax=Vollenhovia emeryi TaxID=411798 RepID=UPI0005F455F4|nr:PREDICTED: transmembrane protease serine 9-like isoform X2 [Vollenhovia emeryi]